MSTAILVGASGLVGGHLLRQLTAEGPRYDRIIALVRKPLDFAHPKLEQRAVDFTHLPDIKADDVFCAVGTTIRKAGSEAAFRAVDFDLPVAVAQMAKRNGVRQFLFVSSVGAEAKSGNFYLRVKGETEAAIRALGFEALHVFRPSFLAGDRAESRPGERIGIAVAQALGWALIGPLARYRAVRAEDVARAMIAAAGEDKPGAFVHEFPF